MLPVWKFELLRLLRRKWFWITALILPLYILLLEFIPVLIEKSLKLEKLVLVKGEESLTREVVLEFSQSPFSKSWKVEKTNHKDKGIEEVEKGKCYAFIELKKEKVEIYLREYNQIFLDDLKRVIKNAYLNYSLINKGLKISEIEKIKEGPLIKTSFKEEKERMYGFLIFIFSLLLYSGLMGYGWLISQRIIEDKDTRFIDVLLLYAKPQSILLGKLFGVGLGYIIQLLVSFISGYIIIASSSSVLIRMLKNLSIEISTILIIVLLFILSFFMFASFNLLAGAIANTMDELKQINTIINMILLINLIVVLVLRRFPTGSITSFLTFFPLSAPFFALMRFFRNELTFIELFAITVSMLILSLMVTFLANKIFQSKVRGKKTSFISLKLAYK